MLKILIAFIIFRDHPKTIKERILRVTVASLCVCLFVYQSSSYCNSERSGKFTQWIGIRWEGLLFAVFLPSFLIFLLFLGPVVMFLVDHGFQNIIFYQPSDIIFWRNYIVVSFFYIKLYCSPIILGKFIS